jgi:hypothetical protein
MTLEERVHAVIAEERTVTGRSLRDSYQRLTQRRDALHGVTERLNLRAEDIGVVEVADAALAYGAAVDGVRFVEDRLRRLGSSVEFEHRMERARKNATEDDRTTPGPSRGVRASRFSAAAHPDRRASASEPSDEATTSPCSGDAARQDEDRTAAEPRAHTARRVERNTVERSLLDANLTLSARRDSLSRAAGVVELCPAAGDAIDIAELAAGFERAAERAFFLGDDLRVLSRSGTEDPPARL